MLSRHSNLLKKYTVLEKKKNFSYNELPRYFLPNDKFTCIFGVFDIVSLSSACRENWFTIWLTWEGFSWESNMRCRWSWRVGERYLDCSQSPIFSWDRLDIPRLTVTGILIFKCTERAGVGDYRFGRWGGRWRGEKLASSYPPPPPK